ncbi:hypothetical protein AB1L88_03915 [Tautonia sp. JC769]|uniref:hypothetical protein n=1 Tax=Tautonia sp. JC769 TaxID=3232135 RepID=UPI003459484E
MTRPLSLKQTLANRLNALRSTGPRSSGGKQRSSQNARTHGLSKVGTHPTAEMAEAIERRTTTWKADYRPEGEAQIWAFAQLVAESVRLDACNARILAAREEHALRASELWDDDRAAEAAQVAATLARQPDRIQPILLQTKHGVRWLLDRWAEVADSLTTRQGWTPAAWSTMLDLLGLPIDARDGLGPWDLAPDDSGPGPGLALVAEAVAALRDRLETVLDTRDDRARLDAELGLNAEDPAPIRLLERYAADARRRFSSFLNELRRLQSLPAAAPAPSSPPGPRPCRPPLRNEPIAPEPAARNEPIGGGGNAQRPPEGKAHSPGARYAFAPATHAHPDSEEPIGPESAARNEPIGPESAPRSPHITPAAPPVRNIPAAAAPVPITNRRARRARAAAARRK